MRKLIILTLLLTVTGLTGSFSQTFYKNSIDGQIFFKINDSEPLTISVNQETREANLADAGFLSDIIKKYQITGLKSPFNFKEDPQLLRIYKLEFSDFHHVDSIINDLQKMKNIEFAERVPLYKAIMAPNDPLYSTTSYYMNWNWHWDKIGAEAAWDICTGSSSVIVAVVDNAIWTSHPDLSGKIISKRDVADNDNDPSPPSGGTQLTQYYWSHGTHCAGLVGASTNNSVGVAGIGYNVGIMAVKTTKNNADPMYMTALDAGLNWAANNGADVISMSFGGPDQSGLSAAYNMLLSAFHNAGIVLVAAAGNNGDGSEDASNVNYTCYPAACNNVIAVGATNADDKRSGFSEYGTWLDVSAPGGYSPNETTSGNKINILSTTYNDTYAAAGAISGKYDMMLGTSMACPIVAGICGLMKSYAPGATPDQIEACLESTATNIDALNSAYAGRLGAGRVNAAAALQCVNAYNALNADFTASATTVSPGAYVTFTDHSTGSPTSWSWTFQGGTPSSSTVQSPTVRYNSSGYFNVSLTVTKSGNSDSETRNSYIHVTGNVGLNEPLAFSPDEISVFPNPAKDNVNILFPAGACGMVNVSICDIYGNILMKSENPLNDSKISFDVSGISSGIYFVIIENMNFKTVKKISLNN